MREEAKNPGAIKRLKLEISRAALNFNGEKTINRKNAFELKNISKNINDKNLLKIFQRVFYKVNA